MSVTITDDLTDIWNGESSLSWSGDSPSLFTTFFREGSGCYGGQVSRETVDAYITVTSFDMSSAAMYIWFALYGQMDTYANGGVGIILGDGTNRIAYYTGGKDYTPFSVIGWQCHMVDATNPPTNYSTLAGSESNLDFSAITQVGVHFTTLQKSLGGAENCFVDIARWGTGITIGGGTSSTPGTFEEAAADDASTSSGKAYGIIREIAPKVYGLQGRVDIGDAGTGSSYFLDKDSVVIFEDNGAGSSLYKMRVLGNSTGTNSFVLGTKVGTGDTAVGASGVTIQSAGPDVALDFTGSNVNTLNVYGSKLFRLYDSIKLSNTSTHEFIGNTVDQSAIAEVNSAILRNNVFSAVEPVSSAHSAALLWNSNINILNCQFNSNTDPNATYKSHGIKHPAAGTFTYNNLKFSGNEADIWFSATTGDLTINAQSGANPGTYTNDSSGSVSINNTISHTLTGLVNDSEVTYTLLGTAEETGTNGSATLGVRTLTDSTKSWTTDQFKGRFLTITGLDGRAYITSNTSTVLYIDTPATDTGSSLIYQIYDENDVTEVFHVENVTGNETSYSYNYTSDFLVDIIIHHVQYEQIVLLDVTMGDSDQSIPITQIAERVYYNPT